jgi:hypothetical protein
MKRFGVLLGLILLLLVANTAYAAGPLVLPASSITGAEGEKYGWSTSIDGDTAVTGNPENSSQGEVYVLKYNGTSWSQVQKLVPSDYARMDSHHVFAKFGYSVCLRGDTLFISAPWATEPSINVTQGAVYVFVYDGSSWVENRIIRPPSDAEGNLRSNLSFGISLASEGNWLMVGASADDVDGQTSTGSVYAYTWIAPNWVQTQRLAAADRHAFAGFGVSLAMSGNTVVIGSKDDVFDTATPADYSGAAYIFEYNSTLWIEKYKLLASDTTSNDYFGGSVSVTNDRLNVLVGAGNGNGGTGAAYIFSSSGSSWLQTKLIASDGRTPAQRGYSAGDLFGGNVLFVDDTAVIGAMYANGDRGCAYVFPYNGSTWTEQSRLGYPGTDTRRNFSDSLATDGSTLAVGASRFFATDTGAVYFYNLSNTGPVADSQSVSTNEDTSKSITLAATDAENDPLSYVIVDNPDHGALSGVAPAFTYTPAANYNGSDSFTFKANDGTADSNIATVSITVNAINDPPVLNSIGNKTVSEGSALSFTATAKDPDNSLTFSLSGSIPDGAAITGGGLFTWTPAEEQGPGDYDITVLVTENGAPPLNDSETITIHVLEVNSPPALDLITEKTINEGELLSFTAKAYDDDIPANTLVFSLDGGAPEGAAITSGGLFTWTPSEAQGPGNYGITVHVQDDSEAPLSDAMTFWVQVNEVNRPPALRAITDKTINEGAELSFSAVARDFDLPDNILTFTLAAGAPDGAAISADGLLTWTPTEAQGPGDYSITIVVTDDNAEPLSDSDTFIVRVNEVNSPPVLDEIGDKSVNEGEALSFTATANDADIPTNTLTFSLESGAPEGAAISADGLFTWTPTEAQGPGDYSITVVVTDNGVPALTNDGTISVRVNEVNNAPALGNIGDKSIAWGNVLTIALSASDQDIPANALSFSINAGQESGMDIDSATGVFTWTPETSQVGSYSVTFRVTDDGSPALYDEETVTIDVGKRKVSVTYLGDNSGQYSDPVLVKASLTDNDGGDLQGSEIAGKTIDFSIGLQSVSKVTDALGVAEGNIVLNQDPNHVYLVLASFAGDSAYLPGTVSEAFDITPEDAAIDYTGLPYYCTASELTTNANVTLRATITDQNDGSRGEILNAMVSFKIVKENGAVYGTYPAALGLVSADNKLVASASTVVNLPVGGYSVMVMVNGYYTGSDVFPLEIALPSPNSISGGGVLALVKSYGQFAGLSGTKINFGFNIKYNKSLKNVQGHVNIIFRDGTHIYQIKTTSTDTLAVNTSNSKAMTAAWTSKATLTDITNPLAPVSIGGNYQLQIAITDKGEPGTADSVAFTLWNGNTLLFSSNWNGAKTVEQVLGGGNIQIRK